MLYEKWDVRNSSPLLGAPDWLIRMYSQLLINEYPTYMLTLTMNQQMGLLMWGWHCSWKWATAPRNISNPQYELNFDSVRWLGWYLTYWPWFTKTSQFQINFQIIQNSKSSLTVTFCVCSRHSSKMYMRTHGILIPFDDIPVCVHEEKGILSNGFLPA